MSAVLTFSDDFNSLSLWNGASGTWATNFWYADPNGAGSTLPGNGEQEWYINANYAPTAAIKPWTVSDGVLTLTAAPADAATQAALGGFQYTSGEINSYHSFSQTYGYFEMRAELPAGQGLWPAFWLLPANGSWPPELDIFEVLGNDPSKVYTTVHTAETGTHTSTGAGAIVSDTSVGYHTYGVDWEADKITWYYDGKAIFQAATPADMHQPMYMIANLAVGGYWPGNANASTPFPAQMNIDYIHVYSSLPDGADTPVAAAPVDPTKPVSLTARDDLVQTLVGGSGADTITAGHLGDTLTGGAGADTFVFKAAPWNAGHITDFTVGVDKLDLTALFKASGYTGSNPVADGYLSFVSDGAGGTKVLYDVDGKGSANPWPYQLVTLDHVSPTGLTAAQVLGTGAAVPTSTVSTAQVSTASTPVASAPAASAAAGLTLTGTDSGASVLTGGAGNDVITPGHFSDTMTGGAGADTFVFKVTPWNAGHITDFTVGVDKLDLTALFKASGYAGTDPVADGYLSFASDGVGGTRVYYDVDGHGAASPWPFQLAILDHVSPTGLTAAQVLGTAAAPAAVAAAPGLSLAASDTAVQVLSGGAGADTITGAHLADTMTGGAGADVFSFKALPWNAGHITDFTPGEDILDLHALFQAAGYHGSDPIADGYLSLRADGHGGTQVYLDTDGPAAGNPWPYLITTLDHVAPTSLHAGDWVI